MDTFNFMQKLNALANTTPTEDEIISLYTEAEELFEEYDDNISDLKSEIKDKDDEIDTLEDGLIEKDKEISELSGGFHLEGLHTNIRTQSAIEELFDNLDYIPIDEIENFVNTHKKL
jgi:predicted RNase H-like nuclease (RuvC/YqgF family)